MIWTEGLGGSKEAYLKASDKLIQCTDGLYVLQKNLMETLLQNNDSDGDLTASSRKIFVNKMKKYVKENGLEQQVSVFRILKNAIGSIKFPSFVINWQTKFTKFVQILTAIFRPFTFSRAITLFPRNRLLHYHFYAFCWMFYGIYLMQKQRTKVIAFRHDISLTEH